MSVYKFMAGLVETVGGTESDYDPHKHRKIKNPTSYLDTMTHMLKGSIGAGILAMPKACRSMGVIGSIITLILVGFFATYCIQLLIDAQYRLCKRHQRGYIGFPKSMLMALREGPPSLHWAAKPLYYFVDITLVIWQLGICTIYFVFIAENIEQICAVYGTKLPVRLHICYLLPPMIIVNLVKDLKMLSPLSSTSNLLLFIALLLVFFYLIENDLEIGGDKLHVKSWLQLPNFIGTSLFALEAVGVVLALEYNMKNPKEFVGLFGLFNIGMCVIIALYLVVGIFGYIKYGDEIEASITLNLPKTQKKAQAAKIAFAVAIFLSFPLQNFVAYNILWRKLQKRYAEDRRCFPDYFLRIVLVLIPWLLALAVPKLGPIISLCGAFCLSLLAMAFPAILNICITYGEPNKYGPLNYKLTRDIIILIIGIMILCSGVYTSILEIVETRDLPATEPLAYRSLTPSPKKRLEEDTPRSHPDVARAVAPTNTEQRLYSFEGTGSGQTYFSSKPPVDPMRIVLVGDPPEYCSTYARVFENQCKIERTLSLHQSSESEAKNTRVLTAFSSPTRREARSESRRKQSSSKCNKAAENAPKPQQVKYRMFQSVNRSYQSRAEGNPAALPEEWVGGVRALRDSHVRLVLRQLKHIDRLNRALDHAVTRTGPLSKRGNKKS
ncbi:proton-coupled amino acid transporter-like protein CG1139 [Pectinophora gossypiella]|uniref:proton-coupled amino acid transporter-like protein CG1139 n=1 Tax=Pectinophora gossypiella TaxID=13191 RepID=UPI00214F35A9|nr:proton-coupled amino acid transporter-like protein CG1139 [Pectinophora gossypiella]